MADFWTMDPKDKPSAVQCCDELKWAVSLAAILRRQHPNGFSLSAVDTSTRWDARGIKVDS